jgi:hypothetical protein
MRRSSAVRRPTPCHFSSLSSLLVHSSLFFWPSPPTVKFAGRSLDLHAYYLVYSTKFERTREKSMAARWKVE